MRQKTPPDGGRVTAVLGPTNTGKTHLAMERMLGHATGMIGFPLRLLARENYDKIVKLKGVDQVALITGEERIAPPRARWFVCTVEAMPLDRRVEFLCVDEIQLAADPERGHVFTDRLLHARGLSETMVLGSDTMKPLIRRLIPNVEFVTRPRFSSLLYTGAKKVTRLPRRSAVVAFSAAEVYAIAETIRRQRGGTAVVLGALSPRARNAQVEMYQSGEVDYLVATDAIGMGLNLDLDHVAFARTIKFDGRRARHLRAAEIGQIAGRAGRHMRDGAFGTTAEVGGLDADLVEAVENHRFDPVEMVQWRNPDLDFRSLEALLASLEQGPPEALRRSLARKRDADDHLVLQGLARQDDIRRRAQGRAMVRLLWDVAQVPDFRKTLADAHLKLVGQMFLHLSGPARALPVDWVAGQMDRLDRADGDIDQLSQRLAHVRTWSYVAHRPDWLADAGHWQERARGVEDRLSDALHDRLTQRFVDRRGAHLIRRLESSDALLGGVTADGAVVIEGHPIGRLHGLVFRADGDGIVMSGAGEQARNLLAAARRVLEPEIAARVAAFEADAAPGADSTVIEVTLTARAVPDGGRIPAGRLLWRGAPIGWLAPGPTALTPQVEPLRSDLVSPEQRQRLRDAGTQWLARAVRRALAPLFPDDEGQNDGVSSSETLSGPARGVLFQLTEAMGMAPQAQVADLVAALDAPSRKALGRRGVAFGAHHVFLRSLGSREALAWRGLLTAVALGLDAVPALPTRAPAPRRPEIPDAWYRAVGHVVLGGVVFGVDRAERLAALARRQAKAGAFTPDSELRALAAVEGEDAVGRILADLGYRPLAAKASEDGAEPSPQRYVAIRPAARARRPESTPTTAQSLQALNQLRELSLARRFA